MKKSHRQLLMVLVAAVFVAYSLWHKRANHADAVASRGQFVVPPGTAGFTLGTLAFTPCELPRLNSAATTAAFCAPFEVPEDRSAPDARKIALRLALIKSDNAGDDDFIVYLAGGPGQSAVDTWPQIAAALAPARKHRHVLLLDQRGTGQSNPLKCSQNPDADDSGFDLDKVRAATRDCLAEVSKFADPRFYTTTAAVEDLEALRQALGGPQFDLVGVSYGTRMAQQYLMRHPDGVRSVVLDSVAPNPLILGNDFARNLDDALKEQFAVCTATPACAKAFGDPDASLQRLREFLRAEPQRVAYTDPLSYQPRNERLDEFGLASLVRMYAYTPETAALLPLSIAEALAGNYAPLVGQVRLLTSELEVLSGNGMQLSVICAEDADGLRIDPRDADTVLGSALVQAMQAQCAIWPRGTRPADFHAPLVSDTPTLILEGQFDPVTPPRYGEEVLAGLSRARLILAQGQGHNVIGRGCLPTLVSRFLDTLDPKQLDVSCVDALGPTPAFIDFNGASP